MAESRAARLSRRALQAMLAVGEPALCPELRARLIGADALEGFRAEHAARIGAAPPFWAVAWPGGQALARHFLDHPELVRGRAVVDLGCGCALAAAAAMRAGAASCWALDLDPNALVAAEETADLNRVRLNLARAAIETFEPTRLGLAREALICCGDMWYDQTLARRASVRLRLLRGAGWEVIGADPGRSFRPRRDVRVLARYATASEDGTVRPCAVFALDAAADGAKLETPCPARIDDMRGA